ncbi:alg5p [Saccharomyces arboricola H-6]|uniref:dolichyl-phosphate beta-glucosyltransferase n=1 Tax=Saccharomyces arboricola (strain H-6 / AS 2.3317 / CBS 10644) TaxID=1160507 RepID=J8PH92_SACAR|nr:alg5p [Saccharomyces arboricola H-6]
MVALRFLIENRNTVCFTFLVALVLSLYLLVYLFSHTPRPPYPEELRYTAIDESGVEITRALPNVGEAQKMDDDEEIILSVVIPSYNETGRILLMLTDAINFLKEKYGSKWEIVIVDDGSTDNTTQYCLKICREEFKLDYRQFRIIKFSQNRGKGGAVRQGFLHIRGKYGLFADADGASNFSDVAKLIEAVQTCEVSSRGVEAVKPVVAIGSRAHMVNTEAVIKRSMIRNCLMYGFHTLVFIFGIRTIKDTQCGFKLFNKPAILKIFPYLHTEGWIFDVEILILAIRKRIQIKEIPISWHEVDGSKMALAIDSIKMARDLVIIRMAYLLGIYRDDRKC